MELRAKSMRVVPKVHATLKAPPCTPKKTPPVFAILPPMKTLNSSINREYALRFLGVALLFLAFSGWFFYDGFVGYPQKNAAFLPVGEVLAQQDLTPTDWMNTVKTGVAPLTEAFEAKGMKPPSKVQDTFNSWIRANDPHALQVEAARNVLRTPLYSAEDIRAQFISAGIGMLATLALLLLVAFRYLTCYTLTDDTLQVVFASKTTRYPLEALSSIDDSQWEKRGIAVVHFGAASVKLDAWHHQGLKPIVEALKIRLLNT